MRLPSAASAALCLTAAIAWTGCSAGGSADPPRSGSGGGGRDTRTVAEPAPVLTAGVRVAAVGDIACAPDSPYFNEGRGRGRRCRDRSVARLIRRWDPEAVLLLGDIQYEDGSLANFRASFDRNWRALRERLRPAPGNHEYAGAEAEGYFSYFGPQAGPDRRGWYSFDAGDWRVYSLNSVCRPAGGCDRESPQVRWLLESAAADASECSMAFWHHARVSSGLHGDDPTVDGLWRAAHQAGVDVVLAGHDHHYERFEPLDARGAPDPDDGIRSFVAGTGGKQPYPTLLPRSTSERRVSGEAGALLLTLHASSYEWEFRTAAGRTLDSGRGTCDNDHDGRG